MKLLKDYSALEILCLAGGLLSGPLASYSAYKFSLHCVGRHLGEIPELIGFVFLVFAPTMVARGVEDMRRSRLENEAVARRP